MKGTKAQNKNQIKSVDAGKSPTSRSAPTATSVTSTSSSTTSLIPPHPYAEEKDFTDIVFVPHTALSLAGLLLGILFFLYAFSGDAFGDVPFHYALIPPIVVFLVFCAVHMPDSLLIRPHPVVWRLILGVAILYTLAATFFLCINLSQAKDIVRFIDPKLRMPADPKNYTADCRIMTEADPYHWVKIVTDEFLAAHAIGYWVKAMIVRDAGVVLIASIVFELIEYSFQHWMENFRECWWDHFIVDFLVCNGGGMVIGLLTLRWLNARTYHWVSLKKIPTLPGKAKRIALQFTPRGWTPHRWAFFYSPHRTMCTVLMILILQWQELNLFAIKYILEIPTVHVITFTRLGIFTLISFPAVREFYEYCFPMQCDSGECGIAWIPRHRIGMSLWIGAVALTVESFTILKYARQGNHFRVPFPSYIALPWIASFTLWALWFMIRYAGYHATKRPVEKQCMLRRLSSWFVLLLSFVPLVGLCMMAAPDLQWGREWFENYTRNIW